MKKVLSWILITVMLLSSVMTAASAAAPDSITNTNAAAAPYSTAGEKDTSIVPSSGSTLVGVDFESGLDQSKFSLGGSADIATSVKKAETGDNHYYSFTADKTATRYLYAKPGACDSYVFSGDIRWETANVTGYYGVYLHTWAGEGGLMLLSRNGSVDVTKDNSNSKTNAATRGTTWYSFEFTRLGTAVSFKLWEKGTAKPAVATLTYTAGEEAKEPYMEIVFRDAGTGNTLSVDNLKIATLPAIDCVAAQSTGKLDADNRYAVRFIAAVNDLQYAKAGFEITAAPIGSTARVFEDCTSTVYSSIIASNELGIQAAYTAHNLGGKYLIALGIKGIPAGLGDVTFTVKPFCEDSDGIRTYGTKKSVTLRDAEAVSNPISEMFDSFAELRANADRLMSAAPCKVSTFGYHRANDGGAAVYQIVTGQPEGPCEKLAEGLWAEMVADDAVYPEQFGAVGDGAADDSTALTCAAAYAKYHSTKLVLCEKDYATHEAVTFGGIDIQSQNAKISYYGMARDTAAVYVESNTNIYGTFNIWSIDNEMVNGGERCGLMFGRYATTSSVTDCHIENVVVTGGSKHTNAVFITGDSHDITIDRIYVPSGTIINRALLIHWGNSRPYKLDRSTTPPTHYKDPADAAPTQHPHNIHIGTIECHDLVTFEGWNDGTSCAISLCGVYDIHVDEIILSNAMEVVHITSGDFGYQYAGEGSESMVSRDIHVGKITATGVSSNLVYSAGRSIYEPTADTWPEIHIGEIYAEGVGEKSRGLSLHETGLTDIGKMTLKGFGDRAVSVVYGTRNVTVDELNVTDHKGQVIVCDSKDGRSINSNVWIQRLNISGSTSLDSAAISLKEIDTLQIGHASIKGCSFTSLLSLGANVNDIRVDEISCSDGGALTTSMVHATAVIADADNISLGNTLDGVALTSGQSCAVLIQPSQLSVGQSNGGGVLVWSNGTDVSPS